MIPLGGSIYMDVFIVIVIIIGWFGLEGTLKILPPCMGRNTFH